MHRPGESLGTDPDRVVARDRVGAGPDGVDDSEAGAHAHPVGVPHVPVRIEEVIAVGSMGVLVAITLVNVLVRYFSDESFAWTEEISVFLMGVLTLAGAAAAASRDRHVRIEFLYEAGSARRRRALALLGAAVAALCFGALTVLLGRLVWDEYRYREITMATGVPRWWFSVWLPVLSAAVTARTIGWGLRRTRER